MTKKSSKVLWILGAALIATGAVGVHFAWPRTLQEPGAQQTARVSRQTLRSQIQATGVVRAQVGAEVKVGARISGRVERLLANVGTPVQKGQPIAQLDDRDLRARLARTQADLAASTAQLGLVRRGARPEEIAEGRAALALAQAELNLASLELERQRSLAAKALATASELDRATRDREVTAARVASAKSRLGILQHRTLPEDLALAEARRQQAEAAVAEAQAMLSYATIAAPISGVVAAVATQEGETVAAGLNSPTFVTILDLDRLEVAAYVDEVDVGRVRVGQSASFSVDSFPDVELTGKVTAIYPRAVVQSNVVNYITTISIDKSEVHLKPDMTATVNISLEVRSNVLAVPDRAVRREGGRRVVQVLEQGRPATRPVRIGIRGAGFTEILSGLREGQTIVTGEASAPQGAGK